MDALCHSSYQERLLHVRLISSETDEILLKKYSEQLPWKYIEQQLVYFPNSLTKVETFIVMAKRIFDDTIIHNAMSINELPPYSIVSLRNDQAEQNKQFWVSIVQSQLHSIFSSLQSLDGIPTKDDIIEITRETQLQWDPLQTFI